jgi:DNA-binding response OmpR family regulator
VSDKKRILLVDDDNVILESMRLALETKGYDIFTAENGADALEITENSDPDLLVLDQMMPKRSGFRVLETLSKAPESTVPVIMITANEGVRHKAYAQMLGVRDYLQKPFTMDQLVEAVERELN